METKISGWLRKTYSDDIVRRKILFYTGILLTFAVLAFSVCGREFMTKIDYKIYDIMTNLVPDKAPSDLVYIVDIDDASLQEVGQWPWPRYKMAQMLQHIAQDGAASVGIDSVFAEEDRTSLKNIKKTFLDDFGIDIELPSSVRGLTDNDGYMAYVLSQGPFVLSNFFTFEDNVYSDQSCTFNPVKIYGMTGAEDFYEAKGILCNIPQFSGAVASAGFINALPDKDGIMRRLPLLINYKYAVYPNLSLMSYMKASGESDIEVENSFSGMYILVNQKKVPLNRDGTVLLNFNNDKKRYRYFSASDVLFERVKNDTFRGKIVLVGSSAAGMNDLHSTSTQAYCPGVEVHATFVDNLINGTFFRVPSWSGFIGFLSMMGWGLIISFFSGKLRSVMLLMILPAVLAVIVGFSYVLLRYTNVYISPAGTIMTISVTWLILTSLNYYIEERRVLIRTRMLSETQGATIRSMASVAETRDPETGGHIFRTQHYVRALAEHLASKGLFKDELTKEKIELIYMSTPLHDVGKVGIPDEILLKPGKLTDEEFTIMKTHAALGAEIIKRAEFGMSESSFLRYAGSIALSHHEKWDGTGYPNSLKEDEIPLCGRLMAVADVYDALISRRHYKDPMPHEQAASIIMMGRGTHFDPQIVDAFFEIEEKIISIATRYKDD